MAISMTSHAIEILDSSLNLITTLVVEYKLNQAGDILQYSKELDEYGQCKFRVSAYDTLLKTYGNIFQPHVNHVRIRRNGTVVWQGAIIEISKLTRTYWEIVAVEYLWYLDRKLIHRTSTDANGTDAIYRIFNSGTMAAAVTAIMTETINDFKTYPGHPMANLTLGTVTNPNYPPNMTDSSNNKLSGGWNFGNGISAPLLQYDFHSVLHVLKSFGIYSYANFQITNGLVFNFKPFLGNDRHYDIEFNFGNPQTGNIIDYNIPLLGQRMANQLTGIATTPAGVILRVQQSDSASVTTYGLIESIAAYADVKDQATLNARIQTELPLISKPDNAAISVTLNEKGFPLGQYDIGDIVSLNIKNNGVTFSDVRRVVGITVVLSDTGREYTTVQTNKLQPWQFGDTRA